MNARAAPVPNSTARVKLKDSCDSCARAKVKCGREHPTCRRCLRNALVCHYSVARRGKAAALHAEPSPPRQSHRLGLAEHVEHQYSLDDLMYAEFGLSADFTPPPPPPTSEMSSGAMLMPALAPTPTPSSAVSDVSTLDPYLLQTLRDDTDELEPAGADLAAPRISPDRRKGSSATTRKKASSSRSCGEKDDRMRILLQTLQALHLSYGDSTSLPGIDTILMTNTEATTNVAALFPLEYGRSRSGSRRASDRSSSSSDSGSDSGSSNTQQTTLQAMLALVCCNSIVDAYGWIVDGGDGGSCSSGCPASMEYVGHAYTNHDMPVAVGNFTLDGAAKHSVIAGLVLSELVRLDRIVDHIVERIMNKGDDVQMDDDLNEIVVLGEEDMNVEVDTDMGASFSMDMDAGSSAVAVTTLRSSIKRKLHTMTRVVHTRLDSVKFQRL